jgi:hypothetical protein
MLKFIKKVFLLSAQLIISPFMLIYIALKWVVDRIKKIFTKK